MGYDHIEWCKQQLEQARKQLAKDRADGRPPSVLASGERECEHLYKKLNDAKMESYRNTEGL